MDERENVLEFFRGRPKPLSFREAVYLMGLEPSGARALKRVLRQLVKSGDIIMTRKGLYGPPEEMELVAGTFEAHGEGYGFVVLDRPGQRDLFVPARAALSAMDGDRVLARVEDPSRRLARVVRITERANRRLAGTLDVTRDACYVKPRKRSVPFELYIPPGERAGARRGQRVLVEITEFPKGLRPASGRVLKVLKRPEDPLAEVEGIVEEYGLPRRFPKEAQAEARLLSGKALGRRKSLVSLPTVTIDGERARDFDDAISIRLGEHGYTLWVHIADVGFYVGWDSPLDIEARNRATSVYFPDRVIPMLPKELSEDLCSLVPGADRPALTVEMAFDRQGVMTGADFYPSLIRSDERLTYTSVGRMLVDLDAKERARYDRLLGDLELMGELAGMLRQRRLKRGSLDFDLPEPEVLLDVQGRPEAIIRAERTLAHILIEEFMIAANEAVAGHLEASGMPLIYRVHEEPDPRRVEEVVRLLKPAWLGRRLGPEALRALMEDSRGGPREEAVSYLVLRSLKQARYSPQNVGHFGLASSCYTHFTSPIRRYPDLVVHRMLRESLSGKSPSDKRAEALMGALEDMALHSSRRERQADEAEQDVINAMRMWYMRDRVGDEFGASVVGVFSYGLRLRLRECYVEGLLHVSALTDDFYVFDERSLSLKGKHTGRRFSLGQGLAVRVERVDMEDREVIFGLADGQVRRGSHLHGFSPL